MLGTNPMFTASFSDCYFDGVLFTGNLSIRPGDRDRFSGYQ